MKTTKKFKPGNLFHNFHVFFLCILSIFLLEYCSKKDSLIQQEVLSNNSENLVYDTTTPTIFYYRDNKKVLENGVDFEDSTLNILISKSSDNVISVNAYTNEVKYITKGIELGLDLQLQLKIEKDLRNYADSIGAITLFDTTGIIDPAYTSYEATYLASIPKIASSETNRTLNGGVWYDNIQPSSPSTIYPGVSVAMWFGAWQNRVSCFVPRFFYGTDIIYNKTFFRKRMATLTGWGSQPFSFGYPPLTPLNNKSKSWLAFGF